MVDQTKKWQLDNKMISIGEKNDFKSLKISVDGKLFAEMLTLLFEENGIVDNWNRDLIVMRLISFVRYDASFEMFGTLKQFFEFSSGKVTEQLLKQYRQNNDHHYHIFSGDDITHWQHRDNILIENDSDLWNHMTKESLQPVYDTIVKVLAFRNSFNNFRNHSLIPPVQSTSLKEFRKRFERLANNPIFKLYRSNRKD